MTQDQLLDRDYIFDMETTPRTPKPRTIRTKSEALETVLSIRKYNAQTKFIFDLLPQMHLISETLRDTSMRMRDDCIDDVYSIASILKEIDSIFSKLSKYTEKE